jgi:hypothetical protein
MIVKTLCMIFEVIKQENPNRIFARFFIEKIRKSMASLTMTKPLLLSLVSKDRTKDILLIVFPLFPFLSARQGQRFSAPNSCFLMLISV